METNRTIPGPQASARYTEEGDRFNRTLFAALDALQEKGISYALIGGVAASGLGRPRSTHDIDIFVRPEDAEAALEALATKGFDTEKTDSKWLFKGWREGQMVDVIFKSSGDIYFDEEMSRHAKPVTYHGREIQTVSPEDLIIIKCAVHNEAGPHHWHDALAILSQAQVDWEYLLKRSRKAPRRLLALLIYAQSNDILIPSHSVIDLFQTLFGEMKAYQTPRPSEPQQNSLPGPDTRARRDVSTRAAPSRPEPLEPRRDRDMYLSGRIKDALVGDPRTGAQDVKVVVSGSHVVVKGEARSQDQRRAIEDVARDAAPGYQIDNQVRVDELSGPPGIEEVL